MADTLRKSRNYFIGTGELYETWGFKKGVGRVPLSIEPCVVELREDGKPTGEKVKAERIAGGLSIKTQNGIMEFKLMFTSIRSNGEPTRNWEMAKSLLNLNPTIGGNPELPVDSVEVCGSVSIYDHKGKDGKLYATLQYAVSKISRAATTDSGVTFGGTGYVQRVFPEMRGEDETGRMIATLLLADNNGRVFPVNVIGNAQEEDEADMSAAEFLEDEVQVGMTLSFCAERTMRHVGGTKKARRVFGKTSQEMSRGFDIEELVLAEADEVGEPEELEDEDGNPIEDKTGWMNPEIVKKAIKARNAMLAELANGDDDTKTEPKTANAKPKAKMKPKGESKRKVDPFDDDDDPFGDF